MTASGDCDLFLACRARVQALLSAHVSHEVVQRTIEAFPLSYEEQSALWLWALPQLGPRDQVEDHPAADSERRRQMIIDRLMTLG